MPFVVKNSKTLHHLVRAVKRGRISRYNFSAIQARHHSNLNSRNNQTRASNCDTTTATMPQDMPPSGGYSAVQYKVCFPSAHSFTLALRTREEDGRKRGNEVWTGERLMLENRGTYQHEAFGQRLCCSAWALL